MQSSCLSLLSLSLSASFSFFFIFVFFFFTATCMCASALLSGVVNRKKSLFFSGYCYTFIIIISCFSGSFFVVIRLIIIIFFVLFFSPDSTECVQETSNSHKEKEGRSTRGNLKSLPLLEETDVHTHTKKPSKAVFKV